MTPTPSDDSWSALYDAQMANYQTALGNDHNMDAKAGVVLAAILAITAFTLTHSLFTCSNRWQFTLLMIGLGLYSLALIMLLIGLFPKSYNLPANSTEEKPDYLDLTHDKLMYQLIADCESATTLITSRLKLKAILFSFSTAFFVIATVLLLIVKLVQV